MVFQKASASARLQKATRLCPLVQCCDLDELAFNTAIDTDPVDPSIGFVV